MKIDFLLLCRHLLLFPCLLQLPTSPPLVTLYHTCLYPSLARLPSVLVCFFPFIFFASFILSYFSQQVKKIDNHVALMALYSTIFFVSFFVIALSPFDQFRLALCLASPTTSSTSSQSNLLLRDPSNNLHTLTATTTTTAITTSVS